eukprot:scaffold115_cov241-Pinguiococcus_pyrenoidosus.AAC.4
MTSPICPSLSLPRDARIRASNASASWKRISAAVAAAAASADEPGSFFGSKPGNRASHQIHLLLFRWALRRRRRHGDSVLNGTCSWLFYYRLRASILFGRCLAVDKHAACFGSLRVGRGWLGRVLPLGVSLLFCVFPGRQRRLLWLLWLLWLRGRVLMGTHGPFVPDFH